MKFFTLLTVGWMLSAASIFAATPYLPYNIDFEKTGVEKQFSVESRVLSTPILRFYTFQGTNVFNPSGYSSYFSFAKDANATSMVVITGVVYSSYTDFQVASNSFARPVAGWYASVMLKTNASTYSWAYGDISIKQAPEVNASGVFFSQRAINGSEYGPFTGSFDGWPFATTSSIGTSYVASVTFNTYTTLANGATNSLNTRVVAIEGSTSVLNQATNSLQVQVDAVKGATGVLNSATGSLQIAVTALNGATSVLNQATNALQGQFAALNGATGVLNSATNALQSQVDALNGATGVLNSATGVLQIAVTALNGATSVLNSATNSLQSQAAALQGATGVLNQATNSLQSQMIALQGATGVLNSATGALQVAVTAINAATCVHEIAIASLNGATGVLNQATNTLQTQVDALNIATGVLNNATNSLQEQTTALQGATGVLNQATNALNSRMGIIETGAVLKVDADFRNLITNTATKAQGDLADTALQSESDTNALEQLAIETNRAIQAEALLYPSSNPSNYVTASVTDGVNAVVSTKLATSDFATHTNNGSANILHFTAAEKAIATNPPSTNGFVTAAVTNDLNGVVATKYPSSNPSNYVTAAITNGFAQIAWVQAQGYITNAITDVSGWSAFAATNPVKVYEYSRLTNLYVVGSTGTPIPDVTGVYTQQANVGDYPSWRLDENTYIYDDAGGISYKLITTGGIWWDGGAPVGDYTTTIGNTGDLTVAYSYAFSTNIVATWKLGFDVTNNTFQLSRDGVLWIDVTNVATKVQGAKADTAMQTLPWTNAVIAFTNEVVGSTNDMIAKFGAATNELIAATTLVRTQLFAGADTTGRITSAAGDANKFLKADGTWADTPAAAYGITDSTGYRGDWGNAVSGTAASAMQTLPLTNGLIAFTNEVILATNSIMSTFQGATNNLQTTKLNASFTNTGIMTAVQITGGNPSDNYTLVATNASGQTKWMNRIFVCARFNSGQVLTNVAAIITNLIETIDTTSSLNPTSGVFVAPRAAYLKFDVMMQFYPTKSDESFDICSGGASFALGQFRYVDAVPSAWVSSEAFRVVTNNEVITLRATSNGGGTVFGQTTKLYYIITEPYP